MTTFRDDKFDYFVTSDGYLFCVPRDLVRERAEAEFERRMYWISLVNRGLVYGMVAFCCVDVALLVLLLVFGGAR